MKVLIGMSGGVDSSVAAYLLKERGYDVIGATLILKQNKNEIEDAKKVADKLGIPHYTFDFSKEFEKEVVDYFTNEYKDGRTPNPCTVCNKKIKWKLMLEKADELGADFIATGHYAKIAKLNIDGKEVFALEETSNGKDQTYALSMLSSNEIGRTIMPLSDYTKDEVREIAKKAGLPTASKSDSMDICFVPDGDYAKFLTKEKSVGEEPGDFVDVNGKVLGRHNGIIHYTVGQRRGLGISADRSLYVIKIDKENNKVILGYEEDTLKNELVCKNVNWIIQKPKKEIAGKVKIRYNHQGEMATIIPDGDNAKVVFDKPVKSITPGQMAVFYKDGYLIGGGVIL